MNLLPKKLNKGDTIGIVAPSRPVNENGRIEIDNFIEYMNSFGIEVKLSKNLFEKNKYNTSAGTPEQRAEDINSMFSDKNIKAIWCLQGGGTANQLLNLIDYDLIKNNPKLFLGKSDVDVLTLAINRKTNLITFHCCDSKIGRNREMDFDYTKKWFKKRLFEASREFEPSKEWTCVNEGVCEGKIKGCNTSSILKLARTEYFPDFTDAILFVEMYKSNAEEIINHFTQLKQIGVFEKIKGIVIGHNFEFEEKKITVEEIIKNLVSEYNFPILKIGEFGHYQPHAFLPLGARVKVDATNKNIEILDDFLS